MIGCPVSFACALACCELLSRLLDIGRDEKLERVIGAAQIIELQNILAAKGYDVGDVDGKLGKNTRLAVKDVQIKMGLPADSYPDTGFLAQLR